MLTGCKGMEFPLTQKTNKTSSNETPQVILKKMNFDGDLMIQKKLSTIHMAIDFRILVHESDWLMADGRI